jgi:hypothetical protein
MSSIAGHALPIAYPPFSSLQVHALMVNDNQKRRRPAKRLRLTAQAFSVEDYKTASTPLKSALQNGDAMRLA